MTKPLHLIDDAVIKTRLVGTLRHWQLESGHIVRHYRTSDWRATMLIVNAIAYLAEQAWHHPDLEISYARVTIRLTTHDMGGVTERDLALAQQIEALVHFKPDPHGALDGTPAGQALISSDD
jgi:pterin-4a-carbinolamine dehydratase